MEYLLLTNVRQSVKEVLSRTSLYDQHTKIIPIHKYNVEPEGQKNETKPLS